MAMKVLVIGASRGIGNEFARQYLADGAAVTATARDDSALRQLRELGATVLALDVLLTQSVAGLAWQLDGSSFDVVVVCPGIYGPRHVGLEAADRDRIRFRHAHQCARRDAPAAPARRLSGAWRQVGGDVVANGFDRLSHGGQWLVVSRIESGIESVLKDASIELAGRAICVALHPGWVRTDMGGEQADLEVADSVSGMRRLLGSLTGDDNGRFINHDGAAIDW